MIDRLIHDIQKTVESTRMPANVNKAYIIFLNEDFDFISNFYQVNTYIGQLANFVSNEDLLEMIKINDTIW